MNPLHTAGNAVPTLNGTDLGGVLDDLAGFHPGIDLIRDGLRLIATERLDLDQTQTLCAALAGSEGCDAITAIAYTVARLTDPDSNPALRSLPLPVQKETALHGEKTAFAYTDPDLHQHAANAAYTITNH